MLSSRCIAAHMDAVWNHCCQHSDMHTRVRSYAGMGTAWVTCESGCKCDPIRLDGTWAQRASLPWVARLFVSQHESCRIRIKVSKQPGRVPQDGHRVVLVSRAERPLLLRLWCRRRCLSLACMGLADVRSVVLHRPADQQPNNSAMAAAPWARDDCMPCRCPLLQLAVMVTHVPQAGTLASVERLPE